jgi:hypothetical protein
MPHATLYSQNVNIAARWEQDILLLLFILLSHASKQQLLSSKQIAIAVTSHCRPSLAPWWPAINHHVNNEIKLLKKLMTIKQDIERKKGMQEEHEQRCM